MRLLLFLLIISAVVTLPFVKLQHRWALAFWKKARLLAIIYAVVILVSAVVALIFRWDAIYG